MTNMILANTDLSMTSVEIAELAGKQHGHVLRDIRAMIIELYGKEYVEKNVPKQYRNRHSEWCRNNADSILEAITGQKQDPIRDLIDTKGFLYKRGTNGFITEFVLNKRLTLTLTSGYSISQRAAIIDRWLALEEAQPRLSVMDQVIASAQELKRVGLDITANSALLNQHQRRLDDMNGDTGYMTALAFCRTRGIKAPLRYARRLGRAATKLSRELDIRVGDVPDERWGTVHSFAVEALEVAMHELDDE
jgi:phage regulator Rha-like protein